MLARSRRHALSLLVTGTLTASAFSATPVLDPTYGSEGVVVVQANGAVDALAVQPDGKLVISYYFARNPSTVHVLGTLYPQALVRLDAHGAIDPSFADGGVVKGGNSVLPPVGTRLVMDRDNAVLMLEQDSAYVSRYGHDGSEDRAFAEAVASATAKIASNPNAEVRLFAIALQPDGRIVLGGDLCVSATNGSLACNALAMRLNADGTLDSSFAGKGYASHFNPAAQFEYARHLVLQPDGKMVLGLLRESDDRQRFGTLLVQLNADGTPDLRFGNAGRSAFIDDYARSRACSTCFDGLVRLPDGRLVAASRSPAATPPGSTASLHCFLEDGSLDTSFGIQGAAKLSDHGLASHLLALPDGKLLVRIEAYSSTSIANMVVRYTPDGVPDDDFGDHGAVALPRGLDIITLGTDGALYAAGASDGYPALARHVGVSSPAIEYYHAMLDHYFVSANPLETNRLDAGYFTGWVRSGQIFNAFGAERAAPAGVSPVCRLYIPPSQGDSHFYSASPAECAQVAVRFPTFILESSNAMFMGLPDDASATCREGWAPIYRVWNNRTDSNHRYTSDRVTRDRMLARGWIAEGYGADAIGMCAPP